ncbi:MAG: hydroxyacid dehydrogenase [Planctomycetota bacterium]|nr:hydroxyacid dehydrogenase [Planctomycetota bacterium]
MTPQDTIVLISDPLPAATNQIIEDAGYQVIEGADQVPAGLGSISGWILRSGTQITAELLDQAPGLKCICRAGAGVDNIDCDAAADRGVLVMNTPTANSNAAAEHAIGLMFSLARNIPQGHGKMASGGWDRKELVGVELEGKTLVVIGLGKIGQRVCRKGNALGMNVIGCDPFVNEAEASSFGAELSTQESALGRADFISLHPPLNDSTRGMVNDDFISNCKDAVRIVNVSRGPVIDQDSLIRGLDSGRVAGAALDVFDQEPPPEDDPFRNHPGIICTPHLGASTVEAQDNVGTQSAHQVVAFLSAGTIENAVNAPRL